MFKICLILVIFWKKTDCFCNYPDCPEIPPDVPVRPAPGDFEAMGTFLSNPDMSRIRVRETGSGRVRVGGSRLSVEGTAAGIKSGSPRIINLKRIQMRE